MEEVTSPWQGWAPCQLTLAHQPRLPAPPWHTPAEPKTWNVAVPQSGSMETGDLEVQIQEIPLGGPKDENVEDCRGFLELPSRALNPFTQTPPGDLVFATIFLNCSLALFADMLRRWDPEPWA